MKPHILMFLALVTALALAAPAAMAAGPGNPGTVGACPNPSAPDADGDGIPNGQDPDYVPPRDGTGRQIGPKAGNGPGLGGWALGAGPWLARQWQWMTRVCGSSGGWGPGDGSGNGGVGPRDGTGYGPGPREPRNCDGTGPRWSCGNPRQ